MRTLSAMIAAAIGGLGATAAASEYQHDSGEQLQFVFLPAGGYSLMLNQYTAQSGANQITQIEFPWHNAPGAQAEVVIWADPDNDGTPHDASVLWSTTINGNAGAGDGTVEMIQVPVPQVSVGAPGTSFFIGFSQLTPLGIQEIFTQISADPSTFLPDRGFTLVDPNHPANLNELMDIQAIEDAVMEGAMPTLMIRADAIPAPSAISAMLGVGLLASRRRR